MTLEYKYVDWNQVYELCLQLYQQVRKAGFSPDLVVGVARGGWVPARIIADFFITQQTANVKVEFYQDLFETEEHASITQPVSGEPRWKNVLVVDDIADSGESLKITVEHIERHKVSRLQTACLHVKPWTDPVPNFYVKKTDVWVIYPWEVKEFTFSFAAQLHSKNVEYSEIESELLKIGLPTQPAKDFLKEWKTFKEM
ncbi:MAG: phosphoribosyltransferase [Promethearchaeota archaeon]